MKKEDKKQLEWLSSMPEFAQGFFCAHRKNTPGFKRFCKAAERKMGILATERLYISNHAYHSANFGAKKRIHHGENTISPGISTKSYQRGSNPWGGKWVHHDSYADYLLIAPAETKKLKKMYYVDAAKQHHIVYESEHYYKIDNQSPEKMYIPERSNPNLKIHTQRRILAMRVPPALKIDYDRKAKSFVLIDSYNEQYHLKSIKNIRDAELQIKWAVDAFRKRRSEKIAIENPEKIWVRVEDSYDAGNCRSMTDSFFKDLISRIGADGPVCVRADMLLSIRNDMYAKRAVSYAATQSSWR